MAESLDQALSASHVIVDFRSAGATIGVKPGAYAMQALRPLHGNWMLACCEPLDGTAGTASSWECPLSPPQSRRLAALLEQGAVAVQLLLLPAEIMDGLQQRPGYRAVFVSREAGQPAQGSR